MSDLQNIKNRFGIIGNYPALNRALEKAIQVAPTDISALVIGESGTGKEFIPKIIHSESKRKHQRSFLGMRRALLREQPARGKAISRWQTVVLFF